MATTSWAQDITGDYALTVSQDPGADDCVWEGNLNLVQSGGNPGTFTGAASVAIVSGPGPCSGFSGSVTGSITGSTLTIGVGISGLGTATFTGAVVGPDDLSGTWSGLGLTGTWSAARLPASHAVPAAPLWALAGMSLLLLLFGRRFLKTRGE